MGKVVHHEGENAKVAIRNIRRDALHQVKELLKEKEITEDDDRRAHEDIQQLTDKHIEAVDKQVTEKEQELLEV
jgi:ribosome recycling factor